MSYLPVFWERVATFGLHALPNLWDTSNHETDNSRPDGPGFDAHGGFGGRLAAWSGCRGWSERSSDDRGSRLGRRTNAQPARPVLRPPSRPTPLGLRPLARRQYPVRANGTRGPTWRRRRANPRGEQRPLIRLYHALCRLGAELGILMNLGVTIRPQGHRSLACTTYPLESKADVLPALSKTKCVVSII